MKIAQTALLAIRRTRGCVSWKQLRYLPACVLLFAAAMKVARNESLPLFLTSATGYSTLVVVEILFEMVLGLWIITNVAPRATKRLVASLFAIFAAVALYKAIAGEKSCGCFGELNVPPGATFVLDVALASLAALGSLPSTTPRETSRRRRLKIGAFLLVALLLSIAVFARVTRRDADVVVLETREQFVPAGSVVLIKPELWLKKECPLIPYCVDGERLKRGRWILALYSSQCDACQKALESASQLARKNETQSAIVDLRANSTPPSLPFVDYAGSLSDEHAWLASFPCVLELNDGVVDAYYQKKSFTQENEREIRP